jgi:adenylate cyclase
VRLLSVLKRIRPWPLAVSLLAFSAYGWFYHFTAFRLASHDLLASLEPTPSRPAQTEVVILAVDLATLRAHGLPQSPGESENELRLLDRELFVKVLAKLRDHSPTVVGIDFLFNAPRNPETDARLASQLARTGNVVLAGAWHSDPISGELSWHSPLEALRKGARAVGSANTPPDPDGVIRNVQVALPLSATTTGTAEPFALVVARVALDTERVIREPGRCVLLNARPSPDRTITVDATGSTLLRPIRAPKGTSAFQTIPLGRFLRLTDSHVLDSLVRKKVVLIGTTDPLFGDMHLTPLSRFASGETRQPGVEILATAVQNLLDGKSLTPAPAGPSFVLMMLLGVGNTLAFVLLGTLAAILLLPIESVLLVAASYSLYQSGILVSVLDAELLALGGAALGAGWHSASERRQKAQLLVTLTHYLSDAVAHEVVRHPHLLRLGGEKRSLTVLFSDIRGFTKLSEKLPPELLVSFLNEYLSEMTELVLQSEGVLDKYMGDAIMAFWGAPKVSTDHALRACESALSMTEQLTRMQPDWAKRGLPPLEIGLGLNTGLMLVGNMGSRRRFDYTVMGDAVNLASRLEGLNKEYCTRILLGPDTAAAVRSAFVLRRLDRVCVLGRREAIVVFELQGRLGEVTPAREKCNLLYEASLEDYFRQDWNRAEDGLKRAMDLQDDAACQVILRRIRQFRGHPPSTDWDGVYVQKSK